MNTIDSIMKEVEALQAKVRQLSAQRQKAKLDQTISTLQKTANDIAHQVKADPYIRFKESEAYVAGLKAEIKSAGTTATNLLTGKELAVKLADNGTTLQTFADGIKEGSVLEIAGKAYFVTGYSFSFAGSQATLLPSNQKALIAPAGTKSTPYSAKDCHFNPSTKKLTLSKRDAIQTGDIVEIAGVKYIPAFTFLASPAGLMQYELAEIGAN